jgi:hypothetical protein
MKITRRIALALILLSGGISILWGISAAQAGSGGELDFRSIYYGTRCLLHHHDPYSQNELENFYQADGGESPSESMPARQAVTQYVNMPTTFIFIAPFAGMPWGAAYALWLICTAGIFTLAAFLMWDVGASYAPGVSLFLVCILLANSEMLFATGNSAGIVVGLCVVAVWCFLQERFVLVGILCLAASLAIKPHDAGFVWLYFLLAGGAHRKRALQTLILTAVLGLFAFAWVQLAAPHWMQNWQANLSAISMHGGMNEPGPSSLTGRTPGMVIDLQAIVSVFRDDPRIYNPVSYLVCGTMLLVWIVRTLQLRSSRARAWLALSAVVALTMLVTYHRPPDAKLLLLAVPACAMLWAEGGRIRWIALLVTSAGVVLTGDIPLAMLLNAARNLPPNSTGILGAILTLALSRPASLILLIFGVFYLWAYLRRTPPFPAKAGTSQQAP